MPLFYFVRDSNYEIKFLDTPIPGSQTPEDVEDSVMSAGDGKAAHGKEPDANDDRGVESDSSEDSQDADNAMHKVSGSTSDTPITDTTRQGQPPRHAPRVGATAQHEPDGGSTPKGISSKSPRNKSTTTALVDGGRARDKNTLNTLSALSHADEEHEMTKVC